MKSQIFEFDQPDFNLLDVDHSKLKHVARTGVIGLVLAWLCIVFVNLGLLGLAVALVLWLLQLFGVI